MSRSIAVLEILAASTGGAVSLSELARELGLAKSSVANICAALTAAHMVRRIDGGYALGMKVLELARSQLSSFDVVQRFHDSSFELPLLRSETVQLAMLDGLDVVYVACRNGVHPIQLASEVGSRLPASCTATGKALLAQLDAEELDALVRPGLTLPRLTPRSITSVPELHRELEAVRKRGFAIDDEETMEGVICIATALPPINSTWSHRAVSVTVLKARLKDDFLDRLAGDLAEFVRRM